MPQNIKLRVSVNAGAPQEGQSGGVEIDYDDALVFSINDTAGVDSAIFRIYEYPTGFAEPAGWSTDGEGAYYYLSKNGAPPPTVAAPSSPLWGDFLCDVKVNQGKRQGVNVSDLYDNSLGLTLPSPNGIPDFPYREDKQFDSWRGWSAKLKTMARMADSGGVAPGVVSIIKSANHTISDADYAGADPATTRLIVYVVGSGVVQNKLITFPVSPVRGQLIEVVKAEATDYGVNINGNGKSVQQNTGGLGDASTFVMKGNDTLLFSAAWRFSGEAWVSLTIPKGSAYASPVTMLVSANSVLCRPSATSGQGGEVQIGQGQILRRLSGGNLTAGKVVPELCNFAGLPTYADDTTAGVGGVASGELYRTVTGVLMVKI